MLGRRAGWVLLVTAGLAAVAVHAAEADLADVVPRVKPSVLAVGSYLPTRSPAFQFRGTGFVVGDGMLVATNAHVLPDNLDVAHSEVLAVARVEEGGKINVRQVARQAVDPTHDLALLRLLGGGRLPSLALDEGATVREGQSVGFTGFPLGTALGMRPVTHRGIVSALTPIGTPQASAQNLKSGLIRRLSNSFEVLQLDATAYPGNSGSPLFDVHSGAVVGIVNMVFVKGAKETALTQPSGITYAIPAKHLRDLMEGRQE